MIILTLPRPPSVNALYRNVPGKGRVKTKRYLTWLRAAQNELLVSLGGGDCKSIKGPVRLTMALGRDLNKDGSISRRKVDASNFIKALEDLCVTCGLIEDDHLVDELRIYWTTDVAPKQVRVCIQPAVSTILENVV